MKFENKPLSNLDLQNWCNYLNIPIKGIFSKNESMSKHHSPCVINLDEFENQGTHWVCCAPAIKKKKHYGILIHLVCIFLENMKIELKKIK